MTESRGDVHLDDLDLFVRVIEARSMSAAARALGVPKSTVSRAVSRLEESLRVKLLQRTSRTLSPTDAGRTLFETSHPHVSALRGASSIVTDLVDAPRGLVRVTAPNDVGSLVLGELIAKFSARYPEVEVEVILTQRTVDLVAEGIDIAIRAGALRDSSLIAKKLTDTEICIVASPSYVQRRGAPKTLEDLKSHDCVLFRPTKGKARWTLEDAEGTSTTVEVRGRLGGDDYGFVASAIAAGAGVGMVPRFLAADGIRQGRMIEVLPGWSSGRGAFYIVHSSGRHVPRKITVFRDFLVDAFRSVPSM